MRAKNARTCGSGSASAGGISSGGPRPGFVAVTTDTISGRPPARSGGEGAVVSLDRALTTVAIEAVFTRGRI
jgi:hypothetical protein